MGLADPKPSEAMPSEKAIPQPVDPQKSEGEE